MSFPVREKGGVIWPVASVVLCNRFYSSTAGEHSLRERSQRAAEFTRDHKSLETLHLQQERGFVLFFLLSHRRVRV